MLRGSFPPDTHVDLPILARAYYRNQVHEIDLDKPMRGQVDIPRLRKGKVGGFAHSVYIMCPVSVAVLWLISDTPADLPRRSQEDAGYPIDNEGNFTTPTHRVRDTLEQIDVAKLLIDKHSDVSCLPRLSSPPAHLLHTLQTFELTLTAKDWRKAMRKGKLGGFLGVEGWVDLLTVDRKPADVRSTRRGHQLGSSLSVLRTYFSLGARYVSPCSSASLELD